MYLKNGNPIISMDTKKKEPIGNLYREGKLYTQKAIEVYDHDFSHLADGVAIPHGLYDVTLNIGYITIGISHDTSEFACDCIGTWWQLHGKKHYINASSILLLCDSGGSNNARHYIFKERLQHLANNIGIEIRIAHYPPYTSKYNPIEHRLFPHVSRACRGVIFKNVQMVSDFMQKTTTRTGLQIIVSINDKFYQPGETVSKEYKEQMTAIFDDYLPQWNYTTVPIVNQISFFYSLVSIRDKIYDTQEALKRTIQVLRKIDKKQ